MKILEINRIENGVRFENLDDLNRSCGKKRRGTLKGKKGHGNKKSGRETPTTLYVRAFEYLTLTSASQYMLLHYLENSQSEICYCGGSTPLLDEVRSAIQHSRMHGKVGGISFSSL